MSFYICIDGERVRIRKYSAASTGPRSIIKIEIEIDDPVTLGYVLQDIAEAQQKTQRERPAGAKKAKRPRAVEQQKMLGLPYYGDRS